MCTINPDFNTSPLLWNTTTSLVGQQRIHPVHLNFIIHSMLAISPDQDERRKGKITDLLSYIISIREFGVLQNFVSLFRGEVITSIKENPFIQELIIAILKDRDVSEETLRSIPPDVLAALNFEEVKQSVIEMPSSLSLERMRLLRLLPLDALRAALDVWKLHRWLMGYKDVRQIEFPIGRMLQAAEDPDQIAAYLLHTLGNLEGDGWFAHCLVKYPRLIHEIFSSLEKSPWKLSVALCKRSLYELDLTTFRNWEEGRRLYPQCYAIASLDVEVRSSHIVRERAWEYLQRADEGIRAHLLASLRNLSPESLAQYILGKGGDIAFIAVAGMFDLQSRGNVMRAIASGLASQEALEGLSMALDLLGGCEQLPPEAQQQAAEFKGLVLSR